MFCVQIIMLQRCCICPHLKRKILHCSDSFVFKICMAIDVMMCRKYSMMIKTFEISESWIGALVLHFQLRTAAYTAKTYLSVCILNENWYSNIWYNLLILTKKIFVCCTTYIMYLCTCFTTFKMFILFYYVNSLWEQLIRQGVWVIDLHISFSLYGSKFVWEQIM